MESRIFFSSSAFSSSSGTRGSGESSEGEGWADSSEGKLGCSGVVAAREGVRGVILARKVELMSPIPTKKSSMPMGENVKDL